MALLVNRFVTQLGTAAGMVAATVTGDTVHPKPNGCLHVKNAGGSPVTVTIPATVDNFSQAGFGDIPIEDIVVVVPATTGDMYIYIPTQSHGSGGSSSIGYSAVTSVTVEYLELERA